MPIYLDHYDAGGLTPEELVFIQNLAAEADYDSSKVVLGPEDALTGVVNGSNRIFTTTHSPKYAIIDGMTRFSGYGYSVSGSGPYTITVDELITPTQFIKFFF